LIVLSAVCHLPASAMSGEGRPDFFVTPFGGYRVSGSMALDDPTFSRLEFGNDAVYGLALGMSMAPIEAEGGGEFEIMWTHQDTELQAIPHPGFTAESMAMNVDQFHFNGLYFPSAAGSWRPYAIAGLGATRFAPAGNTSSITRFSWGIGGGAKIGFTDRLSLRLEAKWDPAMTQSSGSVFCNSATGRCFVSASGDILNQFDFTAGLTLKI
jgi:opacity protein-like surface antigen